MTIINPFSNSEVGVSTTFGSTSAASSKVPSAVNAYTAQDIAPQQEQPSTTVSISGKAIMLARLFKSAGSAEPKYETKVTWENMSGSVYSFLTKGDRDMLASAYEYASERGIDPLKVDSIAFDLGIYRRLGPSGPMDNAGHLFDTDGNPIIPEFNEQDEAIAQRVFTSKAMSDTSINHGFLKALFTPTMRSGHASDFVFLEELVYAFSASGSDGATDPNAQPLVRYNAEDFPTLQEKQAKLGLGKNSAEGIMTSRLLGLELEDSHGSVGVLSLLSDSDKNMLSQLYAIAQAQNEDLSRIDEIALTIGRYLLWSKLPLNN